jgi:hypothetical protein
MDERIFLSIQELSRLLGWTYKAAAKEHLAIRDSLNKKDRRLTIKEYCDYEKIDFDYVWEYLRGKKEP